jgi:hypothetical protein
MLNRFRRFHFLLLFSSLALVVYISDLVTVDKDIYDTSESFEKIRTDSQDSNMESVENVLSDSDNHLVWFMQISDLHISIHHDQTRITDFDEFCKRVLALVQPSVVLATGDLTDAKNGDLFGSKQYEKEWKTYHDLIKDNNLLDKMAWLDVRGNHGK